MWRGTGFPGDALKITFRKFIPSEEASDGQLTFPASVSWLTSFPILRSTFGPMIL